MARRNPISVRLSQECEALLGGLGTNQSAVIRALVLIGADAIGLDLRKVEPDLRTSLSGELPEPIYLRLRDLSEQARSGSRGRSLPDPNVSPANRAPATVASAVTSPERPQNEQALDQAEDVDPLASVGFDFG